MKKVIFGIVCLFMVTCFVDARMINLNEIVEGFANDDYIVFANQEAEEGEKIRVLVNNEESKLYVCSGEDILLTMNYTDNYLEYINANTTADDEAGKQFAEMLLIGKISEVIFKISGYENYNLKSDVPESIDFDTYGLEFDAEENNSSTSGDLIRRFKISLDTEKISALLTAYGEEYEVQDYSYLKPTLTVKETTKSKITLSVSIPSLEDTDFYMCDVYRSESETGEYTKINDSRFMCGSSPVDYEDSSVVEGKTYYYKAKVYGVGTEFGSSVSAQAVTVNNNTNNNSNNNTNKEVKNPKTGVNQFIPLLIAFVASIGCLYLFHKNEMEL